MVDVDDLPRRAAVRTVRLAGLPLGYAGRATIGFGRRLGGRPAELVAAEVQARTAEQLFKVLGELKGGAMKFGQAMSIFEAALPDLLPARRGWAVHPGCGCAGITGGSPDRADHANSARTGTMLE